VSGDVDPLVSADETQGLADLFAGPSAAEEASRGPAAAAEQHVMRGAAHHVPSRAQDTKVVCDFMERQGLQLLPR
jgi:hypothetical protein